MMGKVSQTSFKVHVCATCQPLFLVMMGSERCYVIIFPSHHPAALIPPPSYFPYQISWVLFFLSSPFKPSLIPGEVFSLLMPFERTSHLSPTPTTNNPSPTFRITEEGTDVAACSPAYFPKIPSACCLQRDPALLRTLRRLVLQQTAAVHVNSGPA